MAAIATIGVAAWSILAWRDSSVEDSLERREPTEDRPLFVEITEEAGIDFVHRPRRSDPYFFPNVMGPGCALLDFDQDGLLDAFLINGGAATAEEGSLAGSNRLYHQERAGVFVDVTAGSGLESRLFGMGVAVGDINNDGLPDVYVTNYGPDRLYLNLGSGRFSEVTEAAGIDNALWGASACFVDYDRDGWLDLAVTNYVDYYPSKECADARGRKDFCGPQVFFGTADKLFRNVTGERSRGDEAGSGGVPPEPRFEDVSLSSGIARKKGPGLGIMSADFDGDMWPDIYVANDGTANFLWINQRDGTFLEEAVLRGLAYDAQGRAQAGMGLAWGDVDADGAHDLFITHLAGETNTLYLADGAGGFRDAGPESGLAAPSFPYTGFGTVMTDLDHDGDLDVSVVNGRVKRAVDQSVSAEFWSTYAESNHLFLNQGNGRSRELNAPDPFITDVDVSRGLAAGDVDNDGDVDFLVANAGGPARLYRNDAEKQGHWLIIRAVEPALGGRDAYGAVVTVVAVDRRWERLVTAGSSYLSSNDPRAHFGLGNVGVVDRVEVLWPDGSREVFAGGPVDLLRVVRHGEGELQ